MTKELKILLISLLTKVSFGVKFDDFFRHFLEYPLHLKPWVWNTSLKGILGYGKK